MLVWVQNLEKGGRFIISNDIADPFSKFSTILLLIFG